MNRFFMASTVFIITALASCGGSGEAQDAGYTCPRAAVQWRLIDGTCPFDEHTLELTIESCDVNGGLAGVPVYSLSGAFDSADTFELGDDSGVIVCSGTWHNTSVELSCTYDGKVCIASFGPGCEDFSGSWRNDTGDCFGPGEELVFDVDTGACTFAESSNGLTGSVEQSKFQFTLGERDCTGFYTGGQLSGECLGSPACVFKLNPL